MEAQFLPYYFQQNAKFSRTFKSSSGYETIISSGLMSLTFQLADTNIQLCLGPELDTFVKILGAAKKYSDMPTARYSSKSIMIGKNGDMTM